MDVLENWEEEKRSAYLYIVIAERESNPKYKELFTNLARMAEGQAAIWATQLKNQPGGVPIYKPDMRARIIAALIRKLGPRTLRILLAGTKVRGMSIYRPERVTDEFPQIMGNREEKHGNIKHGSNIRAAVFGVNDGLVSNASLILGVAGAQVNHHFILISGIAGLLAGAFSMSAGEYVSVRSQREMLEYQLELEKHELDTYPEEEAAELAAIYEARGLPKEEAQRIANLLIKDPEKALNTLAREELGINPDDLVSPWGAAIFSFVSFAIGALVPLLPFTLFGDWYYNLHLSVLLTALSLFSVGASLSLFTQRNVWWSGARSMLIGIGAGAVTYLVGSFFGVTPG